MDNLSLMELASGATQLVTAVVLGVWIPIGVLYVINYRKPELGGKLRQKVNAIGRLILVGFVIVGILSAVQALTPWDLTGLESVESGGEPTLWYFIGTNIGFWGGVAVLLVGYRRGKRRKASGQEPTPA